MCFKKDKNNSNESKNYGYPMGPQGPTIAEQIAENCFSKPEETKPEEKEPEFKVLPQIDKRLNKDIQGYGCRFMSLLAIPQFYLKKALTAEQINEIYQFCLKDPDVVKTNAYVTCLCGSKEHVIINKGFEYLGSKNIGSQVNPWRVQFREQIPPGTDYTIVEWPTIVSGVEGSHFELADGDGNGFYDPGDKTFDRFIRRHYNLPENETKFDINTTDFDPESYLIYKVFVRDV